METYYEKIKKNVIDSIELKIKKYCLHENYSESIEISPDFKEILEKRIRFYENKMKKCKNKGKAKEYAFSILKLKDYITKNDHYANLGVN